jgi:hypothetical protein
MVKSFKNPFKSDGGLATLRAAEVARGHKNGKNRMEVNYFLQFLLWSKNDFFLLKIPFRAPFSAKRQS